MGGNALKILGIETERKSTRDLFKIFNKLKGFFNDYIITITKFYRNKKDHGDLDILIKTKDIENIKNIIQDNIIPNGIITNDNVISFDYDNFQIDIICIDPKIWNTAIVFYSYDPVAGFLGKITKGFGLHYGKDGLYYKLVNKNNSHKFILCTDNEKIFNFLGYDFNRFRKGFNTLEEIYSYISNGKFYDKELFQPQNLNNYDRKRSMKRSSFKKFLDMNIRSKYNFKDKEYYIDYIDDWFPGFKDKINYYKMVDSKKLDVNKKFRKIITNFKNGKMLGYIISLYRKSKEDFDYFILNNNIDIISKDFSEFYNHYKELYKMVDKKLGFGKKMGNDIYIHKNYEYNLPKEVISNAKSKIPTDFEYTIVKWNIKDNFISFIKSENFDYSEEPIVDDSYKVLNDIIRYRKKPIRDQIYHHKWMFVKPNYKGFNYDESVLRSLKWYKKYDYDSRMIGYKDYWDSLNINEKYKDEYIKIANRTSRVSKNSMIGKNAVVPKFVEKIANKDDSILDYGAGKYPLHKFKLKEMGFDVKSHDFGNNFNDMHDSDALNYKYDIVYASNVLNVQSTIDMLMTTLKEIINLMKYNSIFIANYPKEPRKMNLSIIDLKNILEEYFDVENLGKNTFLMKKKKLNEDIDWDDFDIQEEEPRKFVKFRSKHRIPKNYEYIDIPRSLKHGSIYYDKYEPIEIIDRYEDWNIVRYTDINGKIVQLGFKDEDLIFGVNESNFFNTNKKVQNYETFTMVIRNHDIIKGNVEEMKYGSNGFSVYNQKTDNKSNYIKPYEKRKLY